MPRNVEVEIKIEFGPRIDACQRLYEYAKGLTKDWPGRALDGSPDYLINILFCRSINTFAAGLKLASMGYGPQVLMLNRSLFEDMVDAHWIATNPDTAVQRFEQHFQHGRMLLADAALKHPLRYPDLSVPEFDPEERKALNKIFGRYGDKSWTGVPLHDRVKQIEHLWKDESSREALHFYHHIPHREANQALHVSAPHLNTRVQVSEDDGQITFLVGPRIDFLDQALAGAFWVFDSIIGLMLERFEIALDAKTRRTVFSARDFSKLSDQQLQETGRNDPCPCGSGEKFKFCHGF